MSLRIGNYATGTDLLLKLGVEFEPETVIIDANDILQHGVDYTPSPQTYDFPPFAHCAIEFRTTENYKNAAMHYVAYVSRMDAHHAHWDDGDTTGRHPINRMYIVAGYAILCDTVLTGHPEIIINARHMVMCYGEVGNVQKTYLSAPISPHRHVEYFQVFDIDRAGYRLLEEIVLSACYAMHQKADVEIVTAARNQRRRMITKTGKKPSPYLWVRVGPGVKRREYAQATPMGHTGKRSEHMVRAHTRTVFGHPFIPDGIYLIPSHQRGSGEQVEKKSYRIEME